MQEALNMALVALKHDEVPIGAVIVYDGKIIAKGYNMRQKKQNALLHAEIVAINKACKKLKSWRLENCDLYVTLEPCPMCAGAIANSRIRNVYYACKEKTSQDGLCEKILSSDRLNHKPNLLHGDLEKECSTLLSNFFKQKR